MNLLEELWRGYDGHLGEIRLIRNGKVVQGWFHTGNPRLAEESAQQSDEEGWDAYFGVLPRTRQEGTAAAVNNSTRVLWADVDAKKTGGKFAGLAGIRLAKQTPSIIVDSGRGWHCYWLLREPAPFSQAERVMRGLSAEVRGDAVYDKPRVLRVPGTHNHKTDPPTPVRIIFWDIERRYRISDFDQYVDQKVYVPQVGSEVKLDLPSWLVELIQQGAPRGQRSEAVFKAVLWMTRYGWADDSIEATIAASPLGEKYRELGNQGPKWMRRTLRAARSTE